METTYNPDSVHRGPNPGIIAIIHVALFITSLVFLGISTNGKAFNGAYNSVSDVQRINAFLQFGSAITLGIFTAAVTSRLHFLGVKVTGVSIALFGGIAASVFMMISSLCAWILVQPDISGDANIVHLVKHFGFTSGGVAHIVALGLLMAGISVPCLFGKYTPKWIAVLGIILAACAELSTFSLLFYPANFFLPIARFGSYVWLIATGFTLVKNNQQIKP